MTLLKHFSCIYEILSNCPAFEETGLVLVNEPWDFFLQTSGEQLGRDLHTAILEAYRPEGINRDSTRLLGEENHV